MVNYVQDFEHTFARDSFGVSFYVFMVVFILLGIPHLMLSLDVYRQWMPRCQALSRALHEGRNVHAAGFFEAMREVGKTLEDLSKYKYNPEQVTVVNANEVITNEDSPVRTVRKKPDSS